MTARPILMSAPMVRALLAGRKTQTRRICKYPIYSNGIAFRGGEIVCHTDYLPPSTMLMDVARGSVKYTTSNVEGWTDECPYGQPGDVLWVRETSAIMGIDGRDVCVARAERMPTGKTLAQTDGGLEIIHVSDEVAAWARARVDSDRWRPSIFMPRWASRLTMKITAVRVERLQDISEEDALAEGLIEWSDPPRIEQKHYGLTIADVWETKASAAYARLWEEINGKGSWAANPWVWALTFSVEKRNVDDVLREAA